MEVRVFSLEYSLAFLKFHFIVECSQPSNTRSCSKRTCEAMHVKTVRKPLPSTHKELSSKPCEVAHTVIWCREQSLAKPLACQACQWAPSATLGAKQRGHLRLCSTFHMHMCTQPCATFTQTRANPQTDQEQKKIREVFQRKLLSSLSNKITQ